MTEPTITCPNCKTEIKLTESLAAPLIESTRQGYEKRLAQQQCDMAAQEKVMREREKAMVRAQEHLDEQVAARMKQERVRIAADEAKKAQLAAATDLQEKALALAELQEVLRQRDAKLAEAQKAQAEMMRKERELDDARRELELTVEKRVKAGLDTTREQARKEADEQHRLKLMEKDQQLLSMQNKIEELKRKAEQGSQQMQGEVQELELESLLQAKFPHDCIEPVPKGEHGGDILQRVKGPLGQVCGTILWESKRTKNWSDGWLTKLRSDQREAKAELAVMVSQALPKDIDTFDVIEGVWVTHPRATLPVAVTLRHSLIEVAAVRQASEGQQTKMEMVYQYLTGSPFRQRVQAIVEGFSTMQDDLHKEKKAIMKQWAKREGQIEGVIQATVGMYGDLQGIAGRSLQEIKGLSLNALAGESLEEQ